MDDKEIFKKYSESRKFIEDHEDEIHDILLKTLLHTLKENNYLNLESDNIYINKDNLIVKDENNHLHYHYLVLFDSRWDREFITLYKCSELNSHEPDYVIARCSYKLELSEISDLLASKIKEELN